MMFGRLVTLGIQQNKSLLFVKADCFAFCIGYNKTTADIFGYPTLSCINATA